MEEVHYFYDLKPFLGAYSVVRIAMHKYKKQKVIFKKYFKTDILISEKRKNDLTNELLVLTEVKHSHVIKLLTVI